MTRRDALLRLIALWGGTMFGAGRFLAGTAYAAEASAPGLLSIENLAFLNEVAETIIPATPDSGGARAADVASFMQEIVRDFYDRREQQVFVAGIGDLNAASAARFSGRAFADLAAWERFDLLRAFERQEPPAEFYRMFKELTVWGYFTSEVGATQALVHVPIPGTFQGCIDVAPGARAWSG
jgi:hypothetical protein